MYFIDLTTADGEKLSSTAKQTATALKLFDELFDSVSGQMLFLRGGKVLKCAIREGPQHLMFWTEAKQYIGNMYFQNETGARFYLLSLENWIVTLNSLEEIFSTLKS